MEDIKALLLKLLEDGIETQGEESIFDSVEDYGNDDELSIILKDGTVYNLPIIENQE